MSGSLVSTVDRKKKNRFETAFQTRQRTLMNTYLDCIPCFFRQVIEACRMINLSDEGTKDIIDAVSLQVPLFEMTSPPPETASIIHRIMRKRTNNPDPYEKIKRESNSLAMKIYPNLKRMVRNSENRLLKAAEIAAAGNIIDYGALFDLNIENEIESILNPADGKIGSDFFRYSVYTAFLNSLENSKTLLYLADNAGEIVFDRIFMEEIIDSFPRIKIYCAVRGHPVINDCTLDDAVSTGIDSFAAVISNGSDVPGTILDSCSPEFSRIWDRSDIIVSKGQGNFEGLWGVKGVRGNIFFMFIAKCPVLAGEVGCNVRDAVFINR